MARAEPAALRLASLVWPPYVGPDMPQDGLSAAIVSSVARELGRKVEVEYFPWVRAVMMGRTDARFAGYFPAYYTAERAQQCSFSTPIGSSTLGLAYLKSLPVHWNTLADLSDKTLAVVNGYSNGEELDAEIAQGHQKVDISQTDVISLRKLLLHRVDAVVIDKLVLRYLLATEPTLSGTASQFAFHDKALADLPLYVCFKRTAEGRKLQQDFDEALRKVDVHRIEDDYFKSLLSRRMPSGPRP